ETFGATYGFVARSFALCRKAAKSNSCGCWGCSGFAAALLRGAASPVTAREAPESKTIRRLSACIFPWFRFVLAGRKPSGLQRVPLTRVRLFPGVPNVQLNLKFLYKSGFGRIMNNSRMRAQADHVEGASTASRAHAKAGDRFLDTTASGEDDGRRPEGTGTAAAHDTARDHINFEIRCSKMMSQSSAG